MKKRPHTAPRQQDHAFYKELVNAALTRCNVGYIRRPILSGEQPYLSAEYACVADHDVPYAPPSSTLPYLTVDVLDRMHREQHYHDTTTQGNRYEYSCFNYFKTYLLGFLTQEGTPLTPRTFIDACNALADVAVQSVLLEGTQPESLDYARRFLRELRRGYADVDGSIETMATLKRIEDKIDIGHEACEAMARQLQHAPGASSIFDLAMQEVQKRHADDPQVQGIEDEYRSAVGRSHELYADMLTHLGFDNTKGPQCSVYSIALLQRAEHAAQAEFMRDRSLKEGHSPMQARNAYIRRRAPELLHTVLGIYPPSPKREGLPHSILTHDADALFAAVKWLDGIQRAASHSAAR